MRHLLATVSVVPLLLTVVHGQHVPICRDWQECRQLALEASSRGEYERFHDLAWGAVQTGPKNDSGLMYLLARAQVLSGRPHDALVMLQRLAEMGVATDAATDADFARTRALPGWPEVAAAIARAGNPTSAPIVAPVSGPSPSSSSGRATRPVSPSAAPGATGATASAPRPAAPAVPAVVPFPMEPAASSDAVQFSTGQFLAAGLAYDVVSRRFVIGDALGRKLIVVGVGADHADDLVRGDSAQFDDVVTLGIDELRGNLWVISTSDTSGESALHRLQLVSGRSLKLYRATPSIGPTRLVDLAVQSSGNVIALDSSGNRLISLVSGGSDLIVTLSLKLTGAKSIAARNDTVLYIAHDDGIAHVDLRSGAVTALSAPMGFDLGRFDAIRAHGNTLVGLQTTPAGSRQLVRLTLNAAGRAVTKGTVIDSQVGETARRLSLTITGDELYYLAADASGPGAAPSSNPSPVERFVIRRLSLR